MDGIVQTVATKHALRASEVSAGNEKLMIDG